VVLLRLLSCVDEERDRKLECAIPDGFDRRVFIGVVRCRCEDQGACILARLHEAEAADVNRESPVLAGAEADLLGLAACAKG
jgi:hypothetical protein